MMRTFDERKNEIFRRAENKAKERRKLRNRLIGIGVPLCLMLTFGSAIAYRMTDNISDRASDEDHYFDQSSGSIYCSFVSAEINGVGTISDYHREISDKLTVDAVFSEINEILPERTESYVEIGDGVKTEETTDRGINEIDGYNITLMTEDGEGRTYFLGRHVLYDTDAHSGISLTEEDYHKLSAVLLLNERS